AMLNTQLNDFVTSGALQRHGIIQMKRFTCNHTLGKRIIVLIELTCLTPNDLNVPKIGNPTGLGLEEDGNAGQGQQPQHPAPELPSGYKDQLGSGPAHKNPYQQQQNPADLFRQNGGPGRSIGGSGGYGGGFQNMPPRSMGEAPASIFPIKSLSPYQNKWTIRARVLQKSEIKTWTNQRGDGKLFNCLLVDESGEIRATGFNDAVSQFYDLLVENQVFYISKATIKAAKAQYNTAKNDYEMSFDSSTSIEPCADTAGVPMIEYNPTDLNKLFDVEKDATIDVVAVIKEVGELNEILSKTTQRPIKKRDIVIVDMSQQEVRMTLWGRQAESFAADGNPIIACKSVRVGDYGGRTLSMYSGSTMSINPDIPEAHRLRGWYDTQGSSMTFTAYSNTGGGGGGSGRGDPVKSIQQIKDENLGMDEKPSYFVTRATLTFIKPDPLWYTACSNHGCNKKVLDNGNGWRCEKCDMLFPQPSHRYMMSCQVADHTGSTWVTAFNETAQAIIGKSADEMAMMKENDNPSFLAAVAAANFKTFDFKIRAKAETYQDEMRVKCNVMSQTNIDFAAASHVLAAQITEYLKSS
ncbi:replication factor rfa1, partial [Blyttiomyces helicus]